MKEKYMGKGLSSVHLGKYSVNIRVNRLWLVIFSLPSLQYATALWPGRGICDGVCRLGKREGSQHI